MRSVIFTILFLSSIYFADGCGTGLFKHKITCQTYYSQLVSLTSLVCTNIARNNITLWTACRSCFTVASQANQNVPSLTQLSLCANMYLMNTTYASCASLLANDTINRVGIQSGCISGFCRFARCARRLNSDMLISTCYNQVALTNNATTAPLRIRLYKNVTSCILARARCSPINPITGQTQNNRYVSTTVNCLGKTTQTRKLVNTLQITADGYLRVVAFPAATNTGNQLCSSNSLVNQSGFTGVTCP